MLAESHPREGTEPDRWADNAACLEANPDEFFDHQVVAGRPSRDVYRTARRYCGQCPVLRPCRQAAELGAEVGLWGGQWRPTARSESYRTINLLPAATTVRRLQYAR